MSAIDTVLNTAPTDDAGARTADLYDWQAAMAAADGLASYLQHLGGALGGLLAADVQIVCEYHEDWVVRLGTEAELVSAKHREASSGPWASITVLVTEGGLGHLFARWLLVDRQASARLVSCAATAKGEATDLVECPGLLRRTKAGEELSSAETAKLKNCVETLARALMMYRKGLPAVWQAEPDARAKTLTLPDGLPDAVREFLLTLTIERPRPNRDLASHAAPSLYAQPITTKLGQPDSVAVAVWEAVLQIFRLRMRARGPSERGGLPLVGAGLATRRVDVVAELESRIVTLQDISVAVKTAVQNPGAYLPLPATARISKLSIKMANGGCSDTSIERAERLRLDYSNYRRERRNSVPGSAVEQRALERALHRIADEETGETRTPIGTWGDAFWSSLSKRLNRGPVELANTGLDGDLTLGGICDLAARCQVWFGPRFDVDAVIATTKAARGALK